jgi:hypothetical protein
MSTTINPNNLTPWWISLSGDQQFTANGQAATGGAMPIACTMSSLVMSLFTVSGAVGGDSVTVTLYKNGQPTAMTCNTVNPAVGSFGTCSDVAHTVPVSIGDVVGVGFSQTNNAPVVKIGTGIRCQ